MRDELNKFKKLLGESENEVILYLLKKLKKDKDNYKGHIPTKYNPGSEWSKKAWLTAEIEAFLDKKINTSYTLSRFNDLYEYSDLKEILKNAFPEEYKIVSDKN